MPGIVHQGFHFLNDFLDLRPICFTNLPHENTVNTVTFFFVASIDAECAEVILCHGAIIRVTQYEIGLAQRGLCGSPIQSY